MYTKSAADLRHYIIHMYEEECIIYEQVVAVKSTFITNDNSHLKMTVTGCRIAATIWLQFVYFIILQSI